MEGFDDGNIRLLRKRDSDQNAGMIRMLRSSPSISASPEFITDEDDSDPTSLYPVFFFKNQVKKAAGQGIIRMLKKRSKDGIIRMLRSDKMFNNIEPAILYQRGLLRSIKSGN